MRRYMTIMALLMCSLTGTKAQQQAATQPTWFSAPPFGQGSTVSFTGSLTYRFGTDIPVGCPTVGWTTPVTTTTSPVHVEYTILGDPAPGCAKSLEVAETASVQILTVVDQSGNTFTVTVPATASTASAACSEVLPPELSPQVPAAPLNCPQMPNAIAAGTDGMVLVDAEVAAPVVLQYCQGNVCNQPFTFTRLPLLIGPNAGCGGATGGTGTGTLYVIEGARPVTLYLTPDGSTTTVQVAAAAGS